MIDLNLNNILNSILQENIDKDSVIDAINNKRVIMMTYDDEKDGAHTGKRWTEPYSLVTLPSGNLGLRGFQYNGDTRRGVPHWKLFRLDRVVSWTPTSSKFTVDREGYNRLGDKQYPTIAQVQFNNDDVWLQRNMKNSKEQNKQNNVDYFGRNIQKPNKQQNGPIPNQTTQQIQTQPTQSGPMQQTNKALKTDRQKSWKKFNDINYQKNKRDTNKLNKTLQQNFGDENDVLDNIDKQKIF